MEAVEKHHPNYLLVGLALIVLTVFEVAVVYVPAIPTLPALLVFGGAKALLIMMYFMHLKFDRRLYTLFFAIGTVEGLLMVWVLVSLIFAHAT
jgi:cytochrome c oxidase subunit IV